MEFTKQEYKEALDATMLYAQSLVKDMCLRLEPSERSTKLLGELTGKHAAIIRATAAELNNPPK